MYCTVNDIEKKLNRETLLFLSDDDKDGVSDSGIIESAITRACILIDAYLQNKYTLPFSSVPALISSLAADIAIAELYLRRPETEVEGVRKKYSEAIKTLLRLGEGDIELEKSVLKRNSNDARSDSSGEEKHFSRGSLSEF